MMTPRIDTHVHCRDWNQSYKATIKQVTELARKNGIMAFIDMPNTEPPIFSIKEVDSRIGRADSEGCLNGYYLNVGLTKDVKQIREAAIVTINPRVVGLKYFTSGKKTDALAITNERDQYKVYETLTRCNYTGNITPHCEKESLFNLGRFNPKEPWTWNDERPPVSEEEAVKDQIRFAMETGFKGHIHIPHVSYSRTIDAIEKAAKEISISGEVTPHHLLYSTDDMRGETGLDKKTNPPIRSIEDVNLLWHKLKEISSKNQVLFTIGTDHAPHTLKEKRSYPYASGHQSLLIYQQLLDELRNHGFSEAEIDNLTYWNAKKIFTKIKE